MPHARRLALAQLARRHRFWVVADEAYHLLRWAPEGDEADTGRPVRMVAHDWEYASAARGASGEDGLTSGGIVSVSSWSKVLAPTLRIGWIEARPSVVGALARRGYVFSGGNPAGISAEVVAEAILSGGAAQHMRGLCAAYAKRCAALCAAVRASEAGLTLRVPCGGYSGGYFVWVRLPPYAADSEAVEEAALEAGVAVLAGTRCSARARGVTNSSECDGAELSRHVRLCFAMLKGSELEEAVRRLSRATLASPASSTRCPTWGTTCSG